MIACIRFSLRAGMLGLLLAFGTSAVMAAGDHDDGHGHGLDEFDFGAAAPEAEPDRTIEITAHDTMEFEPDSVIVEPGEIVRFEVHNAGSVQHSFTLGSPEYQQAHENEMQDMSMKMMADHMKDEPNGIVVQPGETGALVWRFEQGGPIEFACHIPGHYPAGMMGEISMQ